MRPGGLAHKVGANVRDHSLWNAGDRVVVAVSGGLDSCVLLDVLVRTARWHGGRLEVATVDHGLRPGSQDDAAFVAGLAAAHGLPAHVLRATLPADADEDAAREARYAALGSLGDAVLALGHHERDQAETVLVQLLRGTGLGGLAGMGWRVGPRARPLLDVRHDDLHEHAVAHGLSWREDPTNEAPRFLRNRVRHEVLPLLEAIRPGATRAIARTATHAATDLAFIADALAAWGPVHEGSLATSVVRDAPEPVARLAVRRAFPGLSAAHVDAVRDLARANAGTVDAPGGPIGVFGDVMRRTR